MLACLSVEAAREWLIACSWEPALMYGCNKTLHQEVCLNELMVRCRI